jgi:hypothetical protein
MDEFNNGNEAKIICRKNGIMKKILLAIIISFGITGISFSQTSLDTAVNFTVKDVSGINWELFELLDEGKIVVIDFFSTA